MADRRVLSRVRREPAVAERKVHLMLDSGAFSAWKSGAKIDLQEYIKYLKLYSKYLFSYVNLDVLNYGGDLSYPEKAAKGSDRNLQIMLDAGLQPIPVFHQYERFEWLAKLLEDGHPYIGLGSQHTSSLRNRVAWLNQCFSLICDANGRPGVKVHGFAMGAPQLMLKYPFYTVDSTTWILGGSAYGRVSLPHGGGDLSKQGNIYVSRSHKSWQGRHIKQLNTEGPQLDEYLAEVGVTRQELIDSYIVRARVSALHNKRLLAERATNPCRFGRHVRWDGMPTVPKRKPIDDFRLRMFCVAWGNTMDHTLNKIGGMPDRLKSYLNTKAWSEEQLAAYVSTGFPDIYEYGGDN